MRRAMFLEDFKGALSGKNYNEKCLNFIDILFKLIFVGPCQNSKAKRIGRSIYFITLITTLTLMVRASFKKYYFLLEIYCSKVLIWNKYFILRVYAFLKICTRKN